MGKSADLVLFDQHPLSNFSKPLKVWIDGREYFDRDKDLETRPEFQQRKKALEEKLDREQKSNEGPRRGGRPTEKTGQ